MGVKPETAICLPPELAKVDAEKEKKFNVRTSFYEGNKKTNLKCRGCYETVHEKENIS
jgi:hypothetical protein